MREIRFYYLLKNEVLIWRTLSFEEGVNDVFSVLKSLLKSISETHLCKVIFKSDLLHARERDHGVGQVLCHM